MCQIKLTLEAKYIPAGANVTRLTGTKKYKLLDGIKVHKNKINEQEEPETISAGKGRKMLVPLSDSDFYVDTIPDDSRLGIEMDLDTAIGFLADIQRHLSE